MKSIKYLGIFLLALIICLSSCQKAIETKSAKDFLVGKNWKILSHSLNGKDFVIECEKDDIMIFLINNTMTRNPGEIKCDPTEIIESGTWSLSVDEKYFTAENTICTIIDLTVGKFKYTYKWENDVYGVTLIAF